MIDQRTSERFPYTHPVEHIVLGVSGQPPAGSVVRGWLVDLGPGGLGIQTQGLGLEEGTVVQAWIPVSDAPATVPVLTEVKWVREARFGIYRAGLRFVL